MGRTAMNAVLGQVRRSAGASDDDAADHALLARFADDHDQQAFEALVRRHGPLVFGLARRALHDAHLAEDVCQAVFLILARKAATIGRRESVASWLYGVTWRVAGRQRRKLARRPVTPTPPTPLPDPTPHAAAVRELAAVLDEEIHRLSDRFRGPVVLCYLEELTQDEAAARLGWSKGTFRRRLDRGRELLRSRLASRGVTLALGLCVVAAGRSMADPAAIAAAAARFAHGHEFDIAAPVVQLAKEGLRAMFVQKIRTALLVLAVCLVSGGVVRLSARQPVVDPTADAVPEKPRETPLPASPNDPPATSGGKPIGSGWAVAFTPDGTTLVTGGGDEKKFGTIALWDIVTGKPRVWLPQEDGIRAVDVSPDGKVVAAGGWDRTVKLYEAATGKLKSVLREHTGPINAVAFSPNGKLVATASLDRTTCLWDVDQGTRIHTLRGHADWVTAVAFAPDGKRVVTAGKDGTTRVYDTTTGAEQVVLKDGTTPLESVAVSRDGKLIATGSWDCSVRVWEVNSGRVVTTMKGHTAGVTSLAFSPDGKLLLSGAGNFNRKELGEVILWDFPAGTLRLRPDGPTNNTWAVRFAQDGRSFATGSREGTVSYWETATGLGRFVLRDDGGAPVLPPAKPADATALWADLESKDARTAAQAMRRLQTAPDVALPLFADRLRPAGQANAEDDKHIARLIVEMDADEFATRQRATAELEKMGQAAEAALRKAKTESPSIEVRSRAEALLKKLSAPTLSPDQLRATRCVEILERFGTPTAKDLLKKLAGGSPEAVITREAAASIQRLAARP
ncbi:sigma-70 family RNA polymerase sigma factor [Fimbriiglobus ruber]|uniref:High-affnity carbon uptake protein Hat/HatR n=1 Tax=Fimbriiglobus ruber TaxID=1908690 RepID=A0A225DE27_9BACT|nr:sigma-70 family RNA polymerase sigma factor [Fimbriiglobus ruber]OWK35596.1 High-affnity carbon uptake protein Hat/HatR [Fimbriiglobus ruber]